MKEIKNKEAQKDFNNIDQKFIYTTTVMNIYL